MIMVSLKNSKCLSVTSSRRLYFKGVCKSLLWKTKAGTARQRRYDLPINRGGVLHFPNTLINLPLTGEAALAFSVDREAATIAATVGAACCCCEAVATTSVATTAFCEGAEEEEQEVEVAAAAALLVLPSA